MNVVLIGLIIISIISYLVFAIYFNNRIYKFIWKPGTMVFIIILAITGSKLQTAFSYWVLLALFFSLMGDVFLMLQEKWFIHGLASFLLAHILYIFGFLDAYRFTFTIKTLFLTLLFILIVSAFYIYLFEGVKEAGGAVLLIAVAIYIAIITTMVSLAVMTETPILIVAALLFFISDAILAINRFRVSFKLADYLVMSTYFTAQLLFAISLAI